MEKKEEVNLNEGNVKKPIYKKWWFIVGIIVIIVAIIIGIIFLTNNDEVQDNSNNTSTTTTNNTEVSNIKEAKTLEEIEGIVSTDVESTINELNTEWENLKEEVNTYDIYLNEVEKVETYYDKIQSTTEQLCIRLYAYSANCAELILSSSKEYKDKYDDLEMINDIIYENAREEINDRIYDGILKDMEDTFYDGIIKDAEDTVSYSDWYDSRSNEYEIWYDTRSEVYEIYYDTGSDIYEFYYDLRGDVYSNDMEGANKTLQDFQEDVSKISSKGGETNTQIAEKSNSSTEDNTQETKPTGKTTSNNNGLSEEFKNAMDSYESFMNEYVEFMKKYNANPTDPTLISQYSSMLQRYSEQVSAFDKWNSSDMSTEEASYYIDVQARVSQKLLEVTQ